MFCCFLIKPNIVDESIVIPLDNSVVSGIMKLKKLCRRNEMIVMKTLDFKPFFDFKTKVKISTKENEEYVGVIAGVNNDFDTYSGVDEIELCVGTNNYIDIEIPDIISIEKI